jgi:hypothetical protein
MATVTMDTSEYELMMKYKSQLESSLKKERELSEEIKKLNDEKIQALENARMKVVKVNRTTRRDYLLVKKEPSDIYLTLKRMINDPYLDYSTFGYLKNIQSAFYETQTSETNDNEYTECIGVDEFKEELREELKSKLDSEVKIKLKDYESNQSKIDSLLKENKEHSETITTLQSSVKALEKMCSDYSKNEQSLLKEIKEHENSNTEAVEKLSKVKDILKDGYDFFGRGKLLDSIISVVYDK